VCDSVKTFCVGVLCILNVYSGGFNFLLLLELYYTVSKFFFKGDKVFCVCVSCWAVSRRCTPTNFQAARQRFRNKKTRLFGVYLDLKSEINCGFEESFSGLLSLTFGNLGLFYCVRILQWFFKGHVTTIIRLLDIVFKVPQVKLEFHSVCFIFTAFYPQSGRIWEK